MTDLPAAMRDSAQTLAAPATSIASSGKGKVQNAAGDRDRVSPDHGDTESHDTHQIISTT